jgi:phosphopantothenoylcysteine decarboxylase / phosphopantothenate---cysteine ligase
MLITAGPTHEQIDEVRYIANRSSGRMGLALAAAARDARWATTLLLGPVALAAPTGVTVHSFTSTADLARLLERHFPACDVLIMAAAVADYRPARRITGKLARGVKLTLELEPTPDLVATCAARRRADQRVIGFALEEPSVLAARAREKLRLKGLDAIVANPLNTMGAPDITGAVYTNTGATLQPPAGEKAAFAKWLIEWLGKA